jgi:hypothetical protein
MKPSEILGASPDLKEAEKQIDANVSRRAEPPITSSEIANAKPAICPLHHGLIVTARSRDDMHGTVYFCPTGGQYWRVHIPSEAAKSGAFAKPFAKRKRWISITPDARGIV